MIWRSEEAMVTTTRARALEASVAIAGAIGAAGRAECDSWRRELAELIADVAALEAMGVRGTQPGFHTHRARRRTMKVSLLMAEHAVEHGFSETIASAKKERKAAGRYRFRDAAREIAAHTGEDAAVIEGDLLLDARCELLPSYDPGSDWPKRYRVAGIAAWAPLPEYEELYWNDLNRWMSERCPRIAAKFQFPEPPKHLQDSGTTPMPAHRVHRTRGTAGRPCPLDAAIKQAQDTLADGRKRDPQMVRAAMQTLLQNGSLMPARSGPIVAYISGEGFKYKNDDCEGGYSFYSDSALAQVVKRSKPVPIAN
jgi:hypothetical protein